MTVVPFPQRAADVSEAEMSPPELNLWAASVAGTGAALTVLATAGVEVLSPPEADTVANEAAARAIKPHVTKVAGTQKVQRILTSALARESVVAARGLWAAKQQEKEQ